MTAMPTALILGATGGIGRALARVLLQQGWRVKALSRRPGIAEEIAAKAATGHPSWSGLAGVMWHPGDALNAADVRAAAAGVTVIVHAVNPPGYVKWREKALPMLAHSIEAARASGARLLLPGNVYNFGPDAGSMVDEHAPQHPATGKGAVRVEMETMLACAATEARPVRALVVRAGDFFDAQAPSSWFGTVLARPQRAGRDGLRVRRVVYPGVPDVGHAWAYLPDLAETMARLLALDQAEPGRLAPFEVVHFGGHWLPRGIEMAEAVRRVLGEPDLPIKPLPWWLLGALSPIVPLFREMAEMRYLWRVPLRLDQRKLEGLIGPVPHTPLDEAVRACLAGMGCLPTPRPPVKKPASLRTAA